MDKKITNVPGRLHNVAVDEHGNQEPLTGANEIMDDALGMMQSQINAEQIEKNSQTDAAIQTETDRAGREEATLRAQIAATQKQDVVPVETLPAVATADSKKIYRVSGEVSYSDYMVNAAGDNWQLLGTFEFPGIDDEPTAGSNNLVKSGGAFDVFLASNKSLYKNSEVITGKYINAQGIISNATSDYHLVKIHITEDTPLIYTAKQLGSTCACAEYTDSTYSTLKRIIGFPSTSFIFDIFTAGYYAFGWSGDEYAKIYEADIQQKLGLGDNNLSFIGICNGKRIVSTGYLSANSEYGVKKIQIHDEGDYHIVCTNTASAVLLAEFTDSTYTTISRVIIGRGETPVDEVVRLTAGYYAITLTGLTALYTNTFERYRYTGVLKNSLVDYINSFGSKYIDNSGVISNATSEYRVATLELEAGIYQIELEAKTGLALVQYTDNTYSTVKRIYISSQRHDAVTIMSLPNGYYGICLNLDNKERFYKIEKYARKPVGDCIFFEDEIMPYHRINPNGSIIVTSDNTKIVTKHLESGFYDIRLNKTLDNVPLVRYTDDTYTTVDEIMFVTGQNTINSINGRYYLPEGYYAICWNGNANENTPTFKKVEQYREKKKPTFDLSDRNIVKLLPYGSTTYQGGNVFTTNDVETQKGMYSSPYIESVATGYKIARLHISAGFYHIVCPSSGSCMMLNKFIDSTCTEIDKMIFGGREQFDAIVYLEEGYYCFGWSTETNTYVEGEAYISSILPTTKWNVDNGKFTNSDSISIAERLVSKYRTYANEWNLSAVIKPLTMVNGMFECSVGKVQLAYSSSTLVSIGKDANGSYVALSTIDEPNNAVNHKYKEYIDGFTFETGKEYTVNLEQRDGTYRYHNISLVTNRGIEHRFDQLESNWQETVGDGWGEISVIPSIGTCEVRNLFFGYPVDFNNIKLLVYGHSFVEGMNSTVANLDKRFATMLANKIGARNCVIKGQGGAGVGSIGTMLDNDLQLLHGARYIMFCIGTNDRNSTNVANTLDYFNQLVKKYGITPIWLTITPSRTGDTKSVLDAKIRQFENVVDVATIFYNEDGTVNTSLLADNVHPTIEGYQRMYNMIAAQCSYLFDN